jgi:flavin-dependent dehydrogenase
VRSIKVDIVGGSLSGLSTAISLKEHDPSIEVVVHEKYKTIGYNHEGRRCGEAHSLEREWTKWKPTGKSIFNQIRKGEVFVGKKRYEVHRLPGAAFILNRQEFVCQLARDAEKLGALICANERIKAVADLDGDFFVDASGCPSTIKRELGFNQGLKGATYQQTLEDTNCFVSDTVKIFYTSRFGYFWVFPRTPEKNEVNVGIGILGEYDYNLREMLEAFKEEHHITGTINYVLGGLVPLGLQRPLLYKNIFFVGDAGVGTFPFTGQGIYRALMSGDIAGRCIASRHPGRYPHMIHQEFLKWDLVGKTYLRASHVLRHIKPELLLTSFNIFLKAYGGIP